jgi:hypothetical protein
MSTPNATVAELEHALIAAADALAAVMVQQPNEWRRLCRQELTETRTALQFWEAFGLPDDGMIPARVIGARVIDALTQRHPHLCQDEFGSA